MTIIELKARAYDLISLIEQAQAELRQVNETISKALQEQKIEDDKKTVKK